MTVYSDVDWLEIISSVRIGIICTTAHTPEVSARKSSALLQVSTCFIKSKRSDYSISINFDKGFSNEVVNISQISLKKLLWRGSSALWHSMLANIWFCIATFTIYCQASVVETLSFIFWLSETTWRNCWRRSIRPWFGLHFSMFRLFKSA